MKKYLLSIKQMKDYILIALLISITFFIFGPIELYYTNIDEFFFGISDILGCLFLLCIVMSVALVFLQKIFKSEKICNIINAVLFGIGIGLYLQGNYINANYGVLNGATIDWNSYKVYGLYNTFIWIGIIAISILLSIKLKRDIINKIHWYIANIIIAIELLALVILGITTSKPLNVIVTDNEQFTVGDEDNIIIFLLDTFDATVFDEILYSDKGEKLKEQFQDFTYYDNMAGGYPYTSFSVPLILSGEWYDRTQDYSEFVNAGSYSKSDLYNVLEQQGYSIGLYSSKYYLGDSIADLTRNIHSGQERVSSATGATSAFLKLTAFRYFPHGLKQFAASDSNVFNKYHSPKAYKMGADIEFYEKLQNEGITVKNGKSFIFYHLNGIHSPYFMNENIQETKEATEESQALGELKIVKGYIDQLKKKGVYDNSTIIIMADHGYKGLAQNPIFIVKESDSQHEFSVRSAPVSFDDLRGTYSYWINGNTDGRTTIYDFEEDENRIRLFRWYALEDQKNQEVPLVEYAIYGKANDVTSIQKTGTLYGQEGISKRTDVKFDSELKIDFTAEGNYKDIINLGFRSFGGYIYSYGKYTDFSLDMTEYTGGDLKISISIANVFSPPQRLQLYVNDTFVDELEVLSGGNVLTTIIPKECLRKDSMVIKVVYPDIAEATGTVIEGHLDEGMSVVYDYICLSQLEKLEKGGVWLFGTDGTAEKIISDGMSVAEPELRWSLGEESNFIWTTTPKEDVTLAIKLKSVIDDKQNLEIYMNDHFIQEIFVDDLDFEINIPKEALNDGLNNLKILYPNAISPRELNGIEDDRKLSIAYEKIEVR